MVLGNNNTALDSIRAKVLSSLSVDCSLDWLSACREHLAKDNKSLTVDALLFELLYADLRDVVCRNQNSRQSRALRDSLLLSQKPPYHDNNSLSESFSLLCQLEEAADVAKSAEQRLGNNHTNACRKVCLSDGYNNNSLTTNNYDVIMGIESLPISGLDSMLLGGCKILLKGPIQARHGILLLQPANFVVLGGCLQGLVEHQFKAFQQKREGVGKDPTIRALIGSTAALEEETNDGDDDDDEAFSGSGDVVVVVAVDNTTRRLEEGQPSRMIGNEGRKRTISQISNPTTTTAAAAAAAAATTFLEKGCARHQIVRRQGGLDSSSFHLNRENNNEDQHNAISFEFSLGLSHFLFGDSFIHSLIHSESKKVPTAPTRS